MADVIGRVGVDTVQAVTSAAVAREGLEKFHPELLITDVSFGDGAPDGLDLIRYGRKRDPKLRAIVLSTSDDPDHIDAAFEAGAAAYVLKKAKPEDLTAAVRQAFDKSIFLASSPRRASMAAASPVAESHLTRREVEVLRLVAEGHSNAQLARILWVTEQTVKFHLSNVYRKLSVSNRTEASRWAQTQGLLSHPPTRHLTAA